MVVLGGFTRLTGSGLSMVDWRPLMGVLPPLSEEAWQRVFAMYQQSPEFQKVNSYMGVQEFKGIFWLEYLHRLLGRLIGLAFALPLVYFAVRGAIGPRQLAWYLFLFALGGDEPEAQPIASASASAAPAPSASASAAPATGPAS